MNRARYETEVERLIQDRIASLRGLTFDQAGALLEAVDEEVLVEGRKCALTTFRQQLRADEILVTVQLARRTPLGSFHTEKGLVLSRDGSIRDASREELLASGG